MIIHKRKCSPFHAQTAVPDNPTNIFQRKLSKGLMFSTAKKKSDDQILADPWGPKTLKNPCALKTNMFHSSVTVTSFNQDSIRETPRVRIPHDSTITQLRQIHQTVCVGHHGAVQEIPYGKEQKLSVCKVISWFCTGEQHLYQKISTHLLGRPAPPPLPTKKKMRCWDDVETCSSSQLCTSRRHWIFKQKTNILWHADVKENSQGLSNDFLPQ